MSGEKILLVDDEPDIIEFLGYNLTKEGFDVTTTTSGKEAISIATKIKPDLIILDVMMPEMDGIETCHEIRNIDSLKNTLIAFLSARGEDYSQVAGFDAGADDYITKPIKPRLLVSRVKAILRRVNLNDDTIEGIRILDKNCFSVQYHPESSPGPHDSRYLFDEFVHRMSENK